MGSSGGKIPTPLSSISTLGPTVVVGPVPSVGVATVVGGPCGRGVRLSRRRRLVRRRRIRRVRIRRCGIDRRGIGDGGLAPEHPQDVLRGRVVEVGHDHRGAADVRPVTVHAVGAHGLGVEGAQPGRDAEQVVHSQRLVDADVIERGVDQLLGHVGSGGAPVDRLAQHALDEVLLAADAPAVAGAVLLPAAVLLVLVVAGADVGQGGVAGHGEASGLGDVEPRVPISGRVLEGDLHAPDGVDQVLERAEVDLDVVVDGELEVLLDGLHQEAGVVLVEGRVDARLAVRRPDAHPQVSGEGEDGGLRLVGVDPQDHDRVRPVTDVVALGEEGAGVGRTGIDAVAAVRADDEEVLGLHVATHVDRRRGLAREDGPVGDGRRRRRVRGAVDDDASGPGERVVGGPHQPGRGQRADDDEAVEDEDATLRPGTAGPGGVLGHGGRR